MTQVSTTTPKTITAGDTLLWQISLSDYLASASWVLNYRLINAAGKVDIVGTASGDDHRISVTAATSATYAAGDYDYQAFVTKGAERYTVETGRIKILPNLAAAASTFDNRTAARKCLDALDIALAAYGNKAYTQEYEVAGRRMKFNSPGDFLAFRNKVMAEVAREEAAAAIQRGESPRNKTYVRF